MPVQTKTVQSNPIEDFQKWLPMITAILHNKTANKLAQKNELGQLIKSKMKSMETAEVPGDKEQLSKMMNVYTRFNTKVTPISPIQNLFGFGGGPSKQEISSAFGDQSMGEAIPKSPDQTMEDAIPTIPPSTTSTVEGQPVPQDALKRTGEQPVAGQPIAGVQPQADRYTVNFKTQLNRNLQNLRKAGQPIIGGRLYQEAVKDAREYAQAVELKSLPKEGGQFSRGMGSPTSPVAFMASRATEFGHDFNTSEGKSAMVQYFGTREGQKDYMSYLNEVSPQMSTITTGRGILRLNSRTGKMEVIGGKPPSAGTLQTLSVGKNTWDRLDWIEKAMQDKKLQAKVGPIAGRYNEVRKKFIADGDFQYFSNMVSSLITIAYGQSGKQISKAELDMLRDAMLPISSQPPENFLATVRFAKKWLEGSHNDQLQYLRQSGYETQIPQLGAPQQGMEDPLGLL